MEQTVQRGWLELKGFVGWGERWVVLAEGRLQWFEREVVGAEEDSVGIEWVVGCSIEGGVLTLEERGGKKILFRGRGIEMWKMNICALMQARRKDRRKEVGGARNRRGENKRKAKSSQRPPQSKQQQSQQQETDHHIESIQSISALLSLSTHSRISSLQLLSGSVWAVGGANEITEYYLQEDAIERDSNRGRREIVKRREVKFEGVLGQVPARNRLVSCVARVGEERLWVAVGGQVMDVIVGKDNEVKVGRVEGKGSAGDVIGCMEVVGKFGGGWEVWSGGTEGEGVKQWTLEGDFIGDLSLISEREKGEEGVFVNVLVIHQMKCDGSVWILTEEEGKRTGEKRKEIWRVVPQEEEIQQFSVDYGGWQGKQHHDFPTALAETETGNVWIGSFSSLMSCWV